VVEQASGTHVVQCLRKRWRGLWRVGSLIAAAAVPVTTPLPHTRQPRWLGCAPAPSAGPMRRPKPGRRPTPGSLEACIHYRKRGPQNNLSAACVVASIAQAMQGQRRARGDQRRQRARLDAGHQIVLPRLQCLVPPVVDVRGDGVGPRGSAGGKRAAAGAGRPAAGPRIKARRRRPRRRRAPRTRRRVPPAGRPRRGRSGRPATAAVPGTPSCGRRMRRGRGCGSRCRRAPL
jgi:hypothetical protein